MTPEQMKKAGQRAIAGLSRIADELRGMSEDLSAMEWNEYCERSRRDLEILRKTEAVVVKDLRVVPPTPLTDFAEYKGMDGYAEVSAGLARELERDCMHMALRLYSESDDSFAPETIEVMNRWRPRVEALLKGGE